MTTNNQLFIGLSETWIKDHLDAELAIPNYTLHKADRSRFKKSNKGRDSGGVCAYIRNDIAGSIEEILSYSNGVVEILALYSNVLNLVICTLYRQPDDTAHGHPSNDAELKDALNKLEKCLVELGTPSPEIIIGGDFNLPHTCWKNCTPLPGCPRKEKDMIATLNNFLNYFCLHQVVEESTHKDGNLLDCVFVNNENIVHSVSVNKVLQSISHHKVIEIATPISLNKKASSPIEVQKTGFFALNFFHSDVKWVELSKELNLVNWKTTLRGKNASEMLEIIYSTTLKLCQKYVPKKTSSTKTSTKVQRFRRKLCRRRRRVNKLLVHASATQRKQKLTQEILDIEKKLMKSYKEERDFEERKAVGAIKKNAKYFFKYARRFSSIKSNIGPLLNGKGELIDDSFEMANLLKNHYAKMFSKPLNVNPLSDNDDNVSVILSNIMFERHDVVKAIDELKINSAPGLDGFPAILLKQCKLELSEPLYIMWKVSFEEGVVPASLKESPITPLHKGDSRSECKNYRPVALTSHIIKVFEKILKNHIVRFLEDNSLFNPGQHGFRKGRSCLSELLAHFDEIIDGLINGANIDVVYLDFAKAFDKVDFNVLLKKLHKIGVRGKLHDWIKSFLTDRTLYVVVNGVMSLPCLVLSGVAQGSVLGPLLFLIMLIDIDTNITGSSVKSFADDTRVLKTVYDISDINVQEGSLNQIYSWAKINNLEFNDTKFELLQYGNDRDLQILSKYKTSSGIDIDKSEFVSDLGVCMSRDANFKNHIDNICISARKTVSWICRTFKSRSVNTMCTAWKSLVLPKLEYCSQLWCPIAKTDIQKLELVQRNFVRKINFNSQVDYWERLRILKLYSLQRRRERYRIIYTWKIIEHLVPNISHEENRKISVHFTSRYGRKCNIPTFNGVSRYSTIYEGSLAVCGPKLFNVMPQHIRDLTNCSVDTFKANLDKFLCTIVDQPVLTGYIGGNNQLYGSNSLVDILA